MSPTIVKKAIFKVVEQYFECNAQEAINQKTDTFLSPLKRYTAYLMRRHISFYTDKEISNILNMAASTIRNIFTQKKFIEDDVLQELESMLSSRLRIFESEQNNTHGQDKPIH